MKIIFNKKRSVLKLLVAVSVCMLSGNIHSQNPFYIHSHNDYTRQVPFYQAYSQQVHTIEADIYTGKTANELLVAHDTHELETAPTLEELYINPLVFLFEQNKGRPWRNSEKTLQLLIDLKTPVDPTLGILISKLEKYPEVFDPAVNPYAVRIVISGDRPAPSEFHHYPSFIFFDGLIDLNYSAEQLKRVPQISESFRKYSTWDGKGDLAIEEKVILESIIRKSHQLNKPIRFWGAPDNELVWQTLYYSGADIINTDQPEKCTDFLNKLKDRY